MTLAGESVDAAFGDGPPPPGMEGDTPPPGMEGDMPPPGMEGDMPPPWETLCLLRA